MLDRGQVRQSGDKNHRGLADRLLVLPFAEELDSKREERARRIGHGQAQVSHRLRWTVGAEQFRPHPVMGEASRPSVQNRRRERERLLVFAVASDRSRHEGDGHRGQRDVADRACSSW